MCRWNVERVRRYQCLAPTALHLMKLKDCSAVGSYQVLQIRGASKTGGYGGTFLSTGARRAKVSVSKASEASFK
jgi:hypothetical protein